MWTTLRIGREILLVIGVILARSVARNSTETLIVCVGVGLWLATDARARGLGFFNQASFRYQLMKDRTTFAHLDMNQLRISDEHVAGDLKQLQDEHVGYDPFMSSELAESVRKPSGIKQLRIEIEQGLADGAKNISRQKVDTIVYSAGNSVRWLIVIYCAFNRS